MGNTIALADEGKFVKRRYVYDAWGRLVSGSDGLPFNNADRARFKGALWMGPEADIYYMRNRWYEPGTGRFISEDPLGLVQTPNLYGFGAGDPIGHGDPTGLIDDWDWPKCKVWDKPVLDYQEPGDGIHGHYTQRCLEYERPDGLAESIYRSFGGASDFGAALAAARRPQPVPEACSAAVAVAGVTTVLDLMVVVPGGLAVRSSARSLLWGGTATRLGKASGSMAISLAAAYRLGSVGFRREAKEFAARAAEEYVGGLGWSAFTGGAYAESWDEFAGGFVPGWSSKLAWDTAVKFCHR